MSVKEFTFENGLMNEFIEFGYEIYRGDDNWIPPMRHVVDHQLNEGFGFYRKPGNCHRKFIAITGGKVHGRIAALVNSDLKHPDGGQVGTVGFFECVNDFSVAQDLIDSAVNWLFEEMGVSHIWGPMNFDIWHSYRFMTRGFERDLFYGEPYNKPFYPEHFERCGFKTINRWDSLEMEGRENLKKLTRRGSERYEYLMDSGYRFENLDMRHFKEEVRKLYGILCQTFSNFPGFTPISFNDFLQLYPGSRLAIDPDLVTFVYNENDEIAGFMAAFLELADAVRAMGGKKGPFATLRFLKMRGRVDRINFHLGGATPEEISRRNGIGRAGFYYLVNQALNRGYEKIIMTMRMLGNPSRSLAGPEAPAPQRVYALYGLSR